MDGSGRARVHSKRAAKCPKNQIPRMADTRNTAGKNGHEPTHALGNRRRKLSHHQEVDTREGRKRSNSSRERKGFMSNGESKRGTKRHPKPETGHNRNRSRDSSRKRRRRENQAGKRTPAQKKAEAEAAAPKKEMKRDRCRKPRRCK